MKQQIGAILNCVANLPLAALFWCTQIWAEPLKAFDADFSYEISRGGEANFFHLNGTEQTILWSVTCEKPLHNCIALAPGLAMRVASANFLQFTISAAKDSRVSIQEKNYTRDITRVFFDPIPLGAISHFSGTQSFIVIERQGHLISRQATTNLDRVAAYLNWVNSADAKIAQDARMWRESQATDAETTTEGVSEWYEMWSLGPSNQPSQMVPNTKPQSEFAIRSQGGTSYFSETGRSGY